MEKTGNIPKNSRKRNNDNPAAVVDKVILEALEVSRVAAIILIFLSPCLEVELQEAEFAAAEKGFTAVKHQREVGTGYFDAVSVAISGGQSSTTAMKESTEHDQFKDAAE